MNTNVGFFTPVNYSGHDTSPRSNLRDSNDGLGKNSTTIQPQTIERFGRFTIITREQKKSDFNHAKQLDRYTKLFAIAGLDYSKATPLQKHAAFFVDETGGVTRASMQDGFERLHMGKIFSIAASIFIFYGLAASTGTKNGAIQLKDLNKGKHPSDTGTFTTTGDLDLNKFENYRLFAKTCPDLLTADEVAQMRAANSKRDQEISGYLNGALASKGEFDFTMKLFSDRTIVDEKGKSIPAISFKQLLRVYTDGPLLFEEVAARK